MYNGAGIAHGMGVLRVEVHRGVVSDEVPKNLNVA
jgi:hypothetical protein